MRLIFDLDGTLIDSAPDLCHAANSMLAELYGAGPIPVETFATFIGQGLPKQLTRSLRYAGIESPGEEEFARALMTFKKYYSAEPARRTIVFDGVREALDELRAAGARMAVCTNKSEDLAWLALKGLGMDHYFAALVGGETLPVRKPHPEPLRECARRLGEEGGDVLYVGDSETDEEAARAAGFPLLLFTGGYSKKPLDEIEAAARFSHFSELPGLVMGGLQGLLRA